jgi:hypothetical protein
LLFDGYWDAVLPLPFGGKWETERGWGGDVEVGFDELWLASTPVIALRVFGVIVAAALARAEEGVCGLFIIDKKAAVLGDGGGKDIGPARRGVSPEPGVRPVRGVRPVLNSVEEDGCGSCGPASMAGERGPARRELESADAGKDQT